MSLNRITHFDHRILELQGASSQTSLPIQPESPKSLLDTSIAIQIIELTYCGLKDPLSAVTGMPHM